MFCIFQTILYLPHYGIHHKKLNKLKNSAKLWNTQGLGKAEQQNYRLRLESRKKSNLEFCLHYRVIKTCVPSALLSLFSIIYDS